MAPFARRDAPRGLPLALWATIAAIAGTALAVTPEATRSPLLSLGLLLPKHVVFALGAVACALACAMTWRGRCLRLTTFDHAALGYLATGLLAMAVNGFRAPFSLPWIALNLGAFVMVAAASEASRSNREWLADGLVCVGVAVALIALYEAAGGDLWWDVVRRPGATFSNRNALGGFCAILTPLALARAALRPHPLRTCAAAVLLVTVALCRARSSWMGLVAAGLLSAATCIAWKRRGTFPLLPRRGLVAVCAAMALAAVAVNVFPWPGLRWSESAPLRASLSRMLEYESGTGRSRIEQHQVGLAMLAVKPLTGFGPGNWRREAPRFAHAVANQHVKLVGPLWTPASDLLRQAVETGILGLAAAAVMAMSLLAGARRRVMESRDLLTLAVMSGLVVAIVVSGFDALLFRPASVALVAAIAGMLRNDCERRAQRAPAWSFSAAALMAAAVSLAVFAPRYFASRALTEDFTAATVLRLGPSRFLPSEALLAVVTSNGRQRCSTLAPAAILVDTYLPNEPENLLGLARCAKGQGKWEEAEGYLRRALDVEPHDLSIKRELEEVQLPGSPAVLAPARGPPRLELRE